jgi:deferrochelatase/peroxidase EfeB
VHADVAVASRAELADLLRKLTEFTRHQMDKPPTQEGWHPLDPPLPNRRVSITIGFGATLFTSTQGDDRFGIAGLRPSCLKIMPQIDGDDGFLPRDVFGPVWRNLIIVLHAIFRCEPFQDAGM